MFLSERLYFRLVRPPIDTRGRVDLHFPELPVQRMRTPGFMVYRLDLIQERFDCNLAQNLADILSITVRCDENMKIITREPTSVFILYFKGGWSPISPQANYNFSVTFQAQGLRRWVTCQHSKTIQYHWRGLAAYGVSWGGWAPPPRIMWKQWHPKSQRPNVHQRLQLMFYANNLIDRGARSQKTS